MLYLGSDHRGFRLKSEISQFLKDNEIMFRDVGANQLNPDDDYVDFAIDLGQKVVTEMAKGILICGSGVGMSVAVNKVKGVRAAFCFCPKQARLAIEDNNSNVLCLSADLVDKEMNMDIIKSFINTVFSAEERHIRRINKIKKYESIK